MLLTGPTCLLLCTCLQRHGVTSTPCVGTKKIVRGLASNAMLFTMDYHPNRYQAPPGS